MTSAKPISAARSRRATSIAAAVLLVVAVTALLAVQVWLTAAADATRFGVELQATEAGLVTTNVTPDLPADLGGMEPGDLVTELNGLPIHTYDDWEAAELTFERGRPVEVRVEREGASHALRVLPGSESWGGLAGLVLAVGANLTLALLALLQRPDDLRARLLFLLTGTIAIEFATPDLLPLPVSLLVNGFQMGVELHLVSLLPTPHPWVVVRPWLVRTFYAVGLGSSLVASAVWEAGQRGLLSLDAALIGPNAIWYGMMPLWAVGVLVLLGFQALRHPRAEGRHQALLVCLGVLPWACVVLTDLANLLFFDSLRLWSLTANITPLAVFVYPLAIFSAIFLYQLFDLELVVRRSLVYSALATVLAIVFFAIIGLAGIFLSRHGDPPLAVVTGAALVLGLLFQPLRRTLQQLIDRRFFPERYEIRQRLVGLAAELPALGALPAMGSHLVARLCEIFGATSATLLIADPKTSLLVTLSSTLFDLRRDTDHSFLLSPDDPGVQMLRRAERPLPAAQPSRQSASLGQRLAHFEASLVVPVMHQEHLVGLLLMGRARDRTTYLREEIDLLMLLSHHIATVFENARLFESATYESLTGLLRREGIFDLLRREAARAGRYDRPLTVAMADLDHFKRVNDEHGHLAGDQLLQRVAHSILGAVRATDGVGRYGGEEFLVVLPETDIAGAHLVAEKIRAAIEELVVRVDDGALLRASISIGLAALDEVSTQSPDLAESLVGLADERLYAAKKGGRNRVVGP